MAVKNIKAVLPSIKVNMGGNVIEQPLPHRTVEYIDPFLLIHHWKDELPGGQTQAELGVAPHPHRGFSPVTFVFQGAIRHQDSLGHDAVVSAGGTQWMFAGNGITHSERPGKALAQNGGTLEIIQFWVNAPAKHKMEMPFYKPITKEDTPLIEEEKHRIQVVCGEYAGVKGNVTYYSPLNLLRVATEKGADFMMALETGHNTIIYLLDGQISINDRPKPKIWCG